MQNKSIISLAILKANWDIRHSDYIENFVPLFNNLIKIKKYEDIDIDVIKIDFEKEYGLSIPHHPIKAILTRLKNQGFIHKVEYKYLVDKNKIDPNNFETISADQQRKLNKLIESLISYSEKYNFPFNKETAEQALLSFFKENETGLLFATEEKNTLPDTNVSKSSKYLVAKFIQSARNADPEIFNFLTDVAIGTAIATAIVYGHDLQNFRANNEKLNLYFDTGYLLILLGVNGEEMRQAFDELTLSVKEAGAKLFVFEHTYDEMMRILTGALGWLRGGDYDIQKASRVLKYFLASDFTETDVELFIAQVPKTLEKYNIIKAPKPSYSEDIKYQIGESELKRMIIEAYKSDPFFDETQRDYTINKDIESIYSICKLRKGKIAYTLKDASHIFVTTNVRLAKISGHVQSDDNVTFSIPPWITDTLLGVTIWLQNPIKTTVLNEKKLIADAYAAIQPDMALVNRYIREVDQLKKKNELSEDEYYILRTQRISYNILSEKTDNDVENFKPTTSREILDEITKNHLAELNRALEAEKTLSQKRAEELKSREEQITKEETETKKFRGKYEITIDLFARIITWFILPFVIGIILSAILITSFPLYFNSYTLEIGAFVVIALITIAGVNVPQVKKWLFVKSKEILMGIVENRHSHK